MNLFDLLNNKKRNELLQKIQSLPDGDRLYAKALLRAIINRMHEFGIDAYRPYPKQKQWHTADQTFRIMWGANSSGKTYCGVAETCMHLSGIYPSWYPEHNRYDEPQDAWICLEDYDSFEDTHENYIREFVGPLIQSYNTQKHIMTFKTGTKLHVKSYKSGVDAFKSSEIPFIYLDEEPTEKILDACRARIVRVKNGKIVATITPVSGPQWFFKILEKAKESDDYFSINVKMEDNQSLTANDMREFEEGIEDERDKRVRVKGEAVPLIGQKVFKDQHLKNLEEDIEQPRTGILHWRDGAEEQPDHELVMMN